MLHIKVSALNLPFTEEERKIENLLFREPCKQLSNLNLEICLSKQVLVYVQ